MKIQLGNMEMYAKIVDSQRNYIKNGRSNLIGTSAKYIRFKKNIAHVCSRALLIR